MFPIRDSIPIVRTPVIVYTLIIINTVVFLYQVSLGASTDIAFVYKNGLVPLRYYNEVWAFRHGLSPYDHLPFLTATFLHGGWLHIILNMWTLYIFGTSLEGRLGPVPFLIFYLCCAVASTFAHAYFNQGSSVPVIGASGAIAGVIGAYAVIFPRARITMLVPIVFIPLIFSIPAVAFAIIWFGIQVLEGASELLAPSIGDSIAWWAHIGGFLAGLVLLPVFLLIAPASPTASPRWERGPWDN